MIRGGKVTNGWGDRVVGKWGEKIQFQGLISSLFEEMLNQVQHDTFYSFSVFYEGVKYFFSWFSLEPLNPGILEPLVFL
jgi:hypothetical protein